MNVGGMVENQLHSKPAKSLQAWLSHGSRSCCWCLALIWL